MAQRRRPGGLSVGERGRWVGNERGWGVGIREGVLGFVEKEGRESGADGAGTEFAVVLGESGLADFDHVKHFSQARSLCGFGAVEAGAFGGLEMTSSIVCG